MKRLTVYKNDVIILKDVGLAKNYFARLKGLMFKKEMAEDSGLLIVPCNEIHTFCMKFAIDAVYLDKNDCIVFIEEAIAPGKICKLQRKAKKVLELCPNVSSKIGLAPGDKLTFEIN